LVLLGVLASKASARFGVPALLLFLGIGMLAGSEGLGGIEFDDAGAAHDAGMLALACILFAGGLATPWGDVRRVAAKGLALATVGVVVTAAVTGWAASAVLGVSGLTGLLLGATVSSTDAAAVFSVLRSRALGLKHDVQPLLEVESGSNDPMAVVLTIGLIELIKHPDTSVVEFVVLFVRQLGLGALVGLVMARVTVVAVNRLRLASEGLYPVLTLGMVVLTFGLTAAIGGSGFLAVYVAGLVLGTAEYVNKPSIVRFHDAIAWLAQIAMFLVLGLLVFPSRLVDEAGQALVVCGVLVFVARPLAVLLSLAPFRASLRESGLVSWIGLRGAVPIVVATYPLVAGVPEAQRIFDAVFFIVATSVLVQGTTISAVARKLGMVKA
jgi:cell volume regulation protein A